MRYCLVMVLICSPWRPLSAIESPAKSKPSTMNYYSPWKVHLHHKIDGDPCEILRRSASKHSCLGQGTLRCINIDDDKYCLTLRGQWIINKPRPKDGKILGTGSAVGSWFVSCTESICCHEDQLAGFSNVIEPLQECSGYFSKEWWAYKYVFHYMSNCGHEQEG